MAWIDRVLTQESLNSDQTSDLIYDLGGPDAAVGHSTLASYITERYNITPAWESWQGIYASLKLDHEHELNSLIPLRILLALKRIRFDKKVRECVLAYLHNNYSKEDRTIQLDLSHLFAERPLEDMNKFRMLLEILLYKVLPRDMNLEKLETLDEMANSFCLDEFGLRYYALGRTLRKFQSTNFQITFPTPLCYDGDLRFGVVMGYPKSSYLRPKVLNDRDVRVHSLGQIKIQKEWVVISEINLKVRIGVIGTWVQTDQLKVVLYVRDHFIDVQQTVYSHHEKETGKDVTVNLSIHDSEYHTCMMVKLRRPTIERGHHVLH
jgi:hypothetical protein